jgi:membrane protein implicated in regulation of membrane protease activity
MILIHRSQTLGTHHGILAVVLVDLRGRTYSCRIHIAWRHSLLCRSWRFVRCWLLFLGWIQDPLTGFSIWFMISLTFLFALKGFVDQFLPNRTSVSNTDEDLDAFGAKVEVVSPVSDQQEGRIHFQGTSWPALSRREGVSFREGDEAVIIFRKNMTWLIDREVEQPESNPNQEDN